MIDIPLEILEKYDIPVPRYTSYPTSVQFKDISSSEYEKKLKLFDQKKKELSIYIHIPFCRSMCLFCGCAVVLNRNEIRQQNYVNHLLQEIELLQSHLKQKHVIAQLHFGGGTPTCLTEKQFSEIITKLKNTFEFSRKTEMSIEIDPRTILQNSGKKLHFIKTIGFNRVSFGVQDTNIAVQEAVKRRQSYEMTKQTFVWAKQLQFDGISLDLIYGLPNQTLETFKQTVLDILKLRPDRIALFSYAKVPWIKLHQKAIKDELLPSQKEKFAIYKYAREAFIANDYQPIGMDHFALKCDPLAKAFFNKTLDRNFQGYSLKLAENMLGIGLSSIGYVEGAYFQNFKKLEEYQKSIEQKCLPIFKGYILKKKDFIHKWVIKKLMCDFELDIREFEKLFQLNFNEYFQDCYNNIMNLKADGFVNVGERYIKATEYGKLFIRIIASVFDQYYESKLNQYSKSI